MVTLYMVTLLLYLLPRLPSLSSLWFDRLMERYSLLRVTLSHTLSLSLSNTEELRGSLVRNRSGLVRFDPVRDLCVFDDGCDLTD